MALSPGKAPGSKVPERPGRFWGCRLRAWSSPVRRSFEGREPAPRWQSRRAGTQSSHCCPLGTHLLCPQLKSWEVLEFQMSKHAQNCARLIFV